MFETFPPDGWSARFDAIDGRFDRHEDRFDALAHQLTAAFRGELNGAITARRSRSSSAYWAQWWRSAG